MKIPSVQLWTAYLDYIRRRNDINDTTGQARQIVNQSYEFVLDNIGQDRDSGRIWQDYINFIKSGPGQIGGNSWQDMQKMDVLRKAYQRAICIPMANLNTLWKEYDQFELGLNKVAVRNNPCPSMSFFLLTIIRAVNSFKNGPHLTCPHGVQTPTLTTSRAGFTDRPCPGCLLHLASMVIKSFWSR